MKRIVAVVTAGLLVLLTGCSQMNSAASVGDTQISVATVEKSVTSILAERAKVDTSQMTLETGAALATGQVRFHLISLLLADVAAEKKIVNSPADVAARKAQILGQVGGAKALPNALVGAGISPEDYTTYINSVLYSEKLTALAIKAGATTATAGNAIQALVVDLAKRKKVTVNPRYGSWDPVAANVVAADTTKGAVSTASPAAK
ncbi:MAG: hypothetical protein WCH42_05935 [Actinomycetes bacterium]